MPRFHVKTAPSHERVVFITFGIFVRQNSDILGVESHLNTEW